jgi:hypothetical protein
MTTRDDEGLLIDGETVVWSEKPAQGLLFTSRDWMLIPFSSVWCGFSHLLGDHRALDSDGALIYEALWRGVRAGWTIRCRGAIPARPLG